MYNKPMKFYVAGRYDRHPEMDEFAQQLRANGDEVTCEWITGKHEQFKDAHLRNEEFAVDDLKDLFDADGLILFGDDLENVLDVDEHGRLLVPARWATGGRHVEFGIALCLRILLDAGYELPNYRLVLVDHRQNIFHYLEKFVEFYPDRYVFLEKRRQELLKSDAAS